MPSTKHDYSSSPSRSRSRSRSRTPMSRSPTPSDREASPPSRNGKLNGSAHGNGNGEEGAGADREAYDAADRERALAEQLRRRALASRKDGGRIKTARSPSPASSRGRSTSRSRTPPSRSPSPPPRRRRMSPSRSPTRSPSPPRSHRHSSVARSQRRRDRDEEKLRERQRRRSGRDLDDVEDDADRYSSSRRSHARDVSEDRYTDSGRKGSVRRGDLIDDRRSARASRPRDFDDDDDVRSHRSGYSRRRDTVTPEPYGDIDRRRQRPPRRDPYDYDGYYRRGTRQAPDYYDRSYYRREPEPRRRRRSPSPVSRSPRAEPEDYELRSVFCSQLAARLTQRDLGEFFEEKLGEDTVRDVRIVADRVTGRSKGIGYVELVSEDLVDKAIACTGEVLFGIPILVQRTDAARNRGEGASTAQTPIRPNLPQPPAGFGLPKIDPATLGKLPLPPHLLPIASNAIHLGGVSAGAPILNGSNGAPKPLSQNTAARLYVGSLNFSLVAEDVKAVFEPFGEIEDVDLHREPTGKSKGFAFVQFKSAEDAEKAIEHMNGFELAGRNIRVGHVNARGQEGKTSTQMQDPSNQSGTSATLTSSYDDGGGGKLTANSRANLMQMLARNTGDGSSSVSPAGATAQAASVQVRPASIPQATSKAVLLKNMFNPEEETEQDWDKDLAEDVKGECEHKYGPVEVCHVDKDSHGEIYLCFAAVDGATKAIAGLNGRWFGGRPVGAEYISESFLNAKLG